LKYSSKSQAETSACVPTRSLKSQKGRELRGILGITFKSFEFRRTYKRICGLLRERLREPASTGAHNPRTNVKRVCWDTVIGSRLNPREFYVRTNVHFSARPSTTITQTDRTPESRKHTRTFDAAQKRASSPGCQHQPPSMHLCRPSLSLSRRQTSFAHQFERRWSLKESYLMHPFVLLYWQCMMRLDSPLSAPVANQSPSPPAATAEPS
jgi:hypothetical protein